MLPTSMKGEGFYKTYSSVQRMVIHQVLPLLSQSVGRISLPDHGQPFTIVDYGCGEGKNSMIPVRAVVDAVRARRRHEDFLVIHNDLPTNNFNGLLQDVFADRDDSYLPTVPDGDCGKIYVLAGASSFYQQVAPSGSVHFGFSSSALHWLKVVPEGCLREHIFHWGGTVA